MNKPLPRQVLLKALNLAVTKVEEDKDRLWGRQLATVMENYVLNLRSNPDIGGKSRLRRTGSPTPIKKIQPSERQQAIFCDQCENFSRVPYEERAKQYGYTCPACGNTEEVGLLTDQEASEWEH